MDLELEREPELEHLHCRRWHIKMEGHSSLHQEGLIFWRNLPVLLSVSDTVLGMDGWKDGCLDTLLQSVLIII